MQVYHIKTTSMKEVKYKLETAGCTSMVDAVKAIKDCTGMSLKDTKRAFDTGELTCSPSLPGYRKMIEDLDAVGVKVFDDARTQLPKIAEVDREPNAYT